MANYYPIGSAILWAPFFLAAHLLVTLINMTGGRVPADGYSDPYIDSQSGYGGSRENYQFDPECGDPELNQLKATFIVAIAVAGLRMDPPVIRLQPPPLEGIVSPF